jgi:hypothetical protein
VLSGERRQMCWLKVMPSIGGGGTSGVANRRRVVSDGDHASPSRRHVDVPRAHAIWLPNAHAAGPQLDVVGKRSPVTGSGPIACDQGAEIAGRHDSIPIRSSRRSHWQNRAADLTRALGSPALYQPNSLSAALAPGAAGDHGDAQGEAKADPGQRRCAADLA